MEDAGSAPVNCVQDDCVPHFVRITSGGKIKSWVGFSLKFLRDNPGKPLALHTLPTNLSSTGPSAAEAYTGVRPDYEATKSASARNIPRLISVVEIIKREYFKMLTPGPESTGLHQYNHLGFLEELGLDSHPESVDEDSRQKSIAAALQGHHSLRREKTPYMKVTLCSGALRDLENRTTWQRPSVKRLTRSARTRQRRRLLKASGQLTEGV